MPPRPGIRPGGPPSRPMPPRPGHPGPRPLPPRPPVRPGHMPPPPPPPPRYYHRYHHWHDDWFISGLGIGLIIGALSNSGGGYSSGERDYARRAEEVRKAARETAEQQGRHLIEIIERIGPQPALYELNEYWQAQGQTTALDTSDPMRSLKVSGFQENLTIVYWIDRTLEKATVTVTAPAYNVSESVSERYRWNEPAALPATAPPHALPVKSPASGGAELGSAFKRLGFTLSEDARTPQGYLVIQSVVPATAAAYAGVKKGAALTAIDGNSTAQVSVEQLCAFIDRRASVGAAVKITVSENGKERSVRLQL
ncbi:PDZ domain-containing protein [Cloacibacillus sp. An23]|uniref:PDZ domain-containing protein n=1 Tax=Cloacibacillus sp. An23 TaxID=1965591 RepID=UPI0011783026|nr:PDZ domain-containing protein [Cloacibacillus sp. An23]